MLFVFLLVHFFTCWICHICQKVYSRQNVDLLREKRRVAHRETSNCSMYDVECKNLLLFAMHCFLCLH